MRLVATPRCQECQAEESRIHPVATPRCQECQVEESRIHPVATPCCQECQVEESQIHPVAIPCCQTYLPLLHLRLELDQLPSLYLVAIPCCQNLPTLAAKMLPEPLLPTFLATRKLPDPVARPCCQFFFMSNPVA
jgi:hypothetical protein